MSQNINGPKQNKPPAHRYPPPRDESRTYSAGWFLVRASVGLLVGIMTLYAGWKLGNLTGHRVLVFVPWAAVLVMVKVFTLWKTRFGGYLTGMAVAAPFALAGLIFYLILTICGPYN